MLRQEEDQPQPHYPAYEEGQEEEPRERYLRLARQEIQRRARCKHLALTFLIMAMVCWPVALVVSSFSSALAGGLICLCLVLLFPTLVYVCKM